MTCTASDMCREVFTQSIQTTAQMVLITATVQVRHQASHMHLLPVATCSLAVYRLQICGIIRQVYMCALVMQNVVRKGVESAANSRKYCCLCSGGTITLADGQRLQYDWLVLALGSSTSFFGIPGVKDLALPFNDFKDAMKVDHSLVMLHVCIGSAKSCNSIYHHHLAAFLNSSCVQPHSPCVLRS